MDTDLVLTAGLILFVLTIPSLLAGWVEGRLSKIGLFVFMLSASMIVAAQVIRPGGYRILEVPDVMLTVLSRLIS